LKDTSRQSLCESWELVWLSPLVPDTRVLRLLAAVKLAFWYAFPRSLYRSSRASGGTMTMAQYSIRVAACILETNDTIFATHYHNNARDAEKWPKKPVYRVLIYSMWLKFRAAPRCRTDGKLSICCLWSPLIMHLEIMRSVGFLCHRLSVHEHSEQHSALEAAMDWFQIEYTITMIRVTTLQFYYSRWRWYLQVPMHLNLPKPSSVNMQHSLIYQADPISHDNEGGFSPYTDC